MLMSILQKLRMMKITWYFLLMLTSFQGCTLAVRLMVIVRQEVKNLRRFGWRLHQSLLRSGLDLKYELSLHPLLGSPFHGPWLFGWRLPKTRLAERRRRDKVGRSVMAISQVKVGFVLLMYQHVCQT